MPVLPAGAYKPPLPLRNRHAHTIYPAVFRHIEGISYCRERIELPDSDFLDLDWSRAGEHESARDHLCIFLHGLEGSAERSYIKGMVRAFNDRGWDALAVNFRGCSGEANRLLRSYHAGATEDLAAVIDHVQQNHRYTRLMLVGFSLGGNLLLKYLGEQGTLVSSEICGAVGISVPCDLAESVRAMSVRSNSFYMRRFMRNLREKIRAKAGMFPGEIDTTGLEEMTTFQEFDDRYTAPLHGYANAAAYWRDCSCISSLSAIRIPTLILNAADDPFLAPACYPLKQARDNSYVHLEVPRYGGHVGFVDWKKDKKYWSERRALAFFSDVLMPGSYRMM